MNPDMDEGWRWFWLAATAALVLGELAVPGMFFMFSFAIGAAIACILAFADVSPTIQWLVFGGVGGASLAILVPIGRRMSGGEQAASVGATRFSGRQGIVLQEIPGSPHATGLVRVEREEWRAESGDGTPISAGVTVNIIRVDGTRLIVRTPEASE
ncbi:MAG: NfeD family protein [Actinomycetota bacterium]